MEGINLAVAQDVIRCTLCTRAVELNCDTCNVKLCETCVAKHIASDRKRKHEIALFKDRDTNTSRPLIETPELVFTFESGTQKLKRVKFVKAREVWISSKSKSITRLNIDRGELEKVQTQSGIFPNDLTLTREGNLIYTDWKESKVVLQKSDGPETLMTVKGWKLNGLCTTADGDLLVCVIRNDDMESKVIRTAGSVIKQEIQFDEKNKPLYKTGHWIMYVDENRNKDVCVSDCNAEAVVVTTQFGKFRYRYSGGVTSHRYGKFVPRCIATDNMSRVLVADKNNNIIHMLDKDGRFLAYIESCNLAHPCGICVDDVGRLWVGEFDSGKIKVIKYSQ